MATSQFSIDELLEEQVNKNTLVGQAHKLGLYKEGQLFRLTLFKGANFLIDDMGGNRFYTWTEESDRVNDSLQPGAQFIGYNLRSTIYSPRDIDKIFLSLGWNPDFANVSPKGGWFIPVPDTQGYIPKRGGDNPIMSFYQDAVYSLEALQEKSFSKRMLNPKVKFVE